MKKVIQGLRSLIACSSSADVIEVAAMPGLYRARVRVQRGAGAVMQPVVLRAGEAAWKPVNVSVRQPRSCGAGVYFRAASFHAAAMAFHDSSSWPIATKFA